MRSPSPRAAALAAALALGACGGDAPDRIRLASGPAAESPSRTASVLHMPAEPSLAVGILPFKNGTGEPGLDWLTRGLADMLVAELGQASQLTVLPPARLEEAGGAGGIAGAGAAEAWRRLELDALLAGRYYRDGDDLVIDAELRDPDGRELRRERVRGPGLERVFLMVSDLSKRVRGGLAGELGGPAGRDLPVGEMTGSVEAFRHYSDGLENMQRMLSAEADRDFARALELDPRFAAAWLRRAMTRESLGDLAGAQAALVEARTHAERLSEGDELRLRLHEAQLAGDAVRIREVRDALWERAPGDLEARITVATSLFGMRELERAREEFERVLELDPNNKVALNLIGYVNAERGDITAALKYLERYRDLTQNEPNAHDSIGEVLVMAGRLTEGTEHFRRALERWPDFHNSMRRLTEVYAELGEVERSLEYADRWIASAPTDPQRAIAHVNQALVLWRYQRYGPADAALAAAEAAWPQLAEACWLRALLAESQGQDGGAAARRAECFARHAQAVREGGKEASRSAGFLAQCVNSRSLPPGLLDTIEAAAARVPNARQRELFRLWRALVLLREGRDAEATDALEDGGQEIVAGLLGGRYFSRDMMWKYLVEVVDRLPTADAPGGALAATTLEAARRSGRADLLVLGRLLEVQNDQKQGRVDRVRRAYSELGIPLEETWRLAGPFPARPGFHRAFPPEHGVDPAARFEADGREIGWQPAGDPMRDGWVDLAAVHGRPAAWTVGYAAIDVHSPDERVVQVRMGTNESCKLWLDGELVWQAYRTEDAPIDHDIVKVVLRPGANRLLLKVTNSLGDWGFYLRVTDEDGAGMPDLRFQPIGERQAALRGPAARAGG